MYKMLALLVLFVSTFSFGFDAPELWTNGYYHQDEVMSPRLGEITIDANVGDKWQTFVLGTFPEKFMKWNIKRRLESINDIENGRRPVWSGSHNGMVATYGYTRQDSFTSLNNAVKGMGFLPKREKIKEIIALLEGTIDSSFQQKLQILKDLYARVDEVFALDRQLSLELYSEPGFVTQSFLNQAKNPVSVIVFLDVPSWKFKSITQLLDPNDPTLGEYEKDVAHYANLIHSYFHGHFTKQFIAVVYYAVEIYDNSPGKVEARGTRIVPAFL